MAEKEVNQMVFNVSKVVSPLLDVLKVGIENAITGRDLGDLVGMSGAEVRKEVSRLRKLGVPVCASTHGIAGYYLPATQGEAEFFRRKFAKRIAETQAAYEVFKQFANTNEQSKEKPPFADGGKGNTES